MTTIYMSNPIGYALDVIATTRADPDVRARYMPTLYQTIWPNGWISTEADFEALNYPAYVKRAVKRIMAQFRTAGAGAVATFELKDTLEEFIGTINVVNSTVSGQRSTSADLPSAYITAEGLAEYVAESRPDLLLDTSGRYATVRLNPEHWTPIQLRFAGAAGYADPGLRISLATDASSGLMGVGPRGGLTSENVPSVYTLDGLPSRATIANDLDRERERHRTNIISRLRRGPDMNAEFEAKRREHRQTTALNFQKHRSSVEKSKDMVIPTLPFVGHGLKSSRRWGIEIETGAGRDLTGVPDQWDSKGDGSLESAYGGGYRYVSEDDCEYQFEHSLDEEDNRYVDPDDCSYCGEEVYTDGDYDDDDCVELVSPILSSMHSRGLEQICTDLEFAPRTDSAGVHVHVEAKDLTLLQLRELIMSYDHLEPLIESSYDRKVRGYCKQRSASELLDIVRNIRDNPNQTTRQLPKGDRYVTLNLLALDYHGTVEFRAMGPRYNYDHLVRWAMFCREMVNCAKNGATSKMFSKVRTWDDVLAIFEKYGAEYKVAAKIEAEEVQAHLVEV